MSYSRLCCILYPGPRAGSVYRLPSRVLEGLQRGWLRHVPYLREILTDPTVQIHPETAKSRGHRSWRLGDCRVPYNVASIERPKSIRAFPDTMMRCMDGGKAAPN